ncbi:acylphosphatase [Acetohalobium arabaticum]|uniref:Acylphosphatase n=1 Tax=Acetohalobium arabaticum (strain ATCC 49924 / DSM 5501 / Z-7288) TaxID=574087 RepID=D9QQS6_ACEAZ|nr:acylphosphatase [Acetohalobium arabaticum]ADL12867.1 acylphosphatase [Acetohalobium arabaticum DSM 5501]
MSTTSAIKAVVKGRVQGVGYRAFTHQKATKLGLRGYVRSSDGNEVEVIAEGEKESLEELVDLLETGPTRAEINEVKWEWIDATDDYIRFAIKY